MTPPLTRQEINRRAAAARRSVLQRLRREQPDNYRQWMQDAYAELDAIHHPSINGRS